MKHEASDVPRLYAVDRVRCLECGCTYSKPSLGGTVQENPGCPRCGYLGWISASIPLSEDFVQRRSAADQQRHHGAQRG